MIHVCSVEELRDGGVGIGLGVSGSEVEGVVEVGTCTCVWPEIIEIGGVGFPVDLSDAVYKRKLVKVC